MTQPGYGKAGPTEHNPQLLYHFGRAPGEKTDVAKDNPKVDAELKDIVAKYRERLKPGEPRREKRLPAVKK